MKKMSDNFYHAAIKSVFPDVWKIETPLKTGLVAVVFIAYTNNEVRVCRFNEKSIIVRNHNLTNFLQGHNVPIKTTKIHEYKGQYFESYEFDPHQTLSEALPSMSKDEIIDTYKSALRIQANLSSFSVHKFGQIDKSHFMDIYKTTMPIYIKNPVMRYLYGTFYKHFSGGEKVYVLHTDLTPDNMLVSDNHRDIVRLIDFDAISICNENMAVFSMLRRYPLSNVKDFVKYYQNVSGHQLNYYQIMFVLKLFRKTAGFRSCLNKIVFSEMTKKY